MKYLMTKAVVCLTFGMMIKYLCTDCKETFSANRNCIEIRLSDMPKHRWDRLLNCARCFLKLYFVWHQIIRHVHMCVVLFTILFGRHLKNMPFIFQL